MRHPNHVVICLALTLLQVLGTVLVATTIPRGAWADRGMGNNCANGYCIALLVTFSFVASYTRKNDGIRISPYRVVDGGRLRMLRK